MRLDSNAACHETRYVTEPDLWGIENGLVNTAAFIESYSALIGDGAALSAGYLRTHVDESM